MEVKAIGRFKEVTFIGNDFYMNIRRDINGVIRVYSDVESGKHILRANEEVSLEELTKLRDILTTFLEEEAE